MTAPGGNEHAAIALEDAGNAVTIAIGTAMEALDWMQGFIELDDEPVRTAGRPGFMNPHGAHAAALQRFEETVARGQRRRDPESAIDVAHHVGTIIILEQHELDQPVARCEQAQPRAAM